MNLFINSPCYYTQEFGIIDDIYHLCRTISKNIDITLYTEVLDTIGITPIIAPKNLLDMGKWKENKLVSKLYRFASISLVSDFDSFVIANIPEKKKIIVDNIIKSLGVVKRKLKNQFDYERIVLDIKKWI